MITFIKYASSRCIISCSSSSSPTTVYPLNSAPTLSNAVLTQSSSAPSVNFFVIITATYIGSDGNPYTPSVSSSLSESTSSIQGTLSGSSGTSEAFRVYFMSSGNKYVVGTFRSNGVTVTTGINFSIQKLVISMQLISTPQTTLTPFSISITIYDSTQKNVENSIGTYPISINLTPTALFNNGLNQLIGTTKQGVYTFSSVTITQANVYKMIASSADMVSSSLTVTIAIPPAIKIMSLSPIVRNI
jgi:hypothetical protein